MADGVQGNKYKRNAGHLDVEGLRKILVDEP
jgi:hypothetical protein